MVSLQTGKINDIHRQWKYVGGGVKIRELTFTGSVVISPTLLLWLAINLYILSLPLYNDTVYYQGWLWGWKQEQVTSE